MSEGSKPSVGPVIGQLDWSLMVACPKCEGDMDLSTGDYDADDIVSHAIFTNAWDELQGFEVTCEHCKHEFRLDRVEY